MGGFSRGALPLLLCTTKPGVRGFPYAQPSRLPLCLCPDAASGLVSGTR